MRVVLSVTIVILSLLVLLVGCADDPNPISSPEDIGRHTTIGALAGSPSLFLAGELGRAVAYTSEIDMMNDLRAGILGCVIMESTTAEELVSNVSGVRILSEPLVEYELRIGVPRENTALLSRINEALEILERNGTLRGIADQYFARRDFDFVPVEDYEDEREVGGYLRVALPPDSPPFSFRNAEGSFVGMDIDVVRAVADVINVDLQVIETDLSNLVEAVWLGIADISLGWHSLEDEGLISVSEPYARAVHVVIVRRR